MIDPRQHFNIYRCDRAGRGGGVGLLALIPRQFKSSEHSLSVDQHALSNNTDCEIVCVDVHLNMTRYRFIVVYRPLNSSYLNKTDLLAKPHSLKMLIESLTHHHHTTIVVGDFNLPQHIDWFTNDCVHDDVMFNCFNSLGFVEFVNLATHSSMQSDNILDLNKKSSPTIQLVSLYIVSLPLLDAVITLL